ncbi:MAG: hypothetical protein ACK5C3_14685, partial [bacterium]
GVGWALTRAAAGAPSAEGPMSNDSSSRGDRGERFAPRRERLAPRRTLIEPGPIPFTRSAAIPPMPASPARAPAVVAPAPVAAAEPAPAPAPAPAPVPPSRARIIKGELPAQLVPELAGLEPIALRAPRDNHIELAIDGEGRLHVVGRATEAAAILRVRGWARDHAEILALADNRISRADPMIDLVVPDLREARSIDGVTVHVLTLVEVAGRRAYVAQVAPA